MAEKKKIIGLSCGRVNGNSEILLKEALMGAEEIGMESEIIRAMDLRVKHCTGCEACSMAMARGKEPRCAIKDDDVEWILEKVLVEDCGLIVSTPVYHLRANACFEIINERMLPTMFRNFGILKKTRVGAIISVGGGEPEWTPLGLTSANIFVQHTRKLVDQIQVNFVGRPGAVLAKPEYLERARELGRRVGRAMMMPIDEVKYLGEDKDVSCPVCHCNVIQVFDKLPDVHCPVCWVHGVLSVDGDRMKVAWNVEDAKHPRFSEHGVFTHLELIKNLQKKFLTEDQGKVKDLLPKYAAYGNIVKPGM